MASSKMECYSKMNGNLKAITICLIVLVLLGIIALPLVIMIFVIVGFMVIYGLALTNDIEFKVERGIKKKN